MFLSSPAFELVKAEPVQNVTALEPMLSQLTLPIGIQNLWIATCGWHLWPV